MAHCNLNTLDGTPPVAFYLAAFGLDPRMRQVDEGGDATAMGLGPGTASVTTFLYDHRGPRAAPALELVHWLRPATRVPGPGDVPPAFLGIGFAAGSLRHARRRLEALGAAPGLVEGGLTVRGERRAGLVATDPDGVRVEVVEDGSGRGPATFCHERMACTDPDATLDWYRAIGWRPAGRGVDEDGVERLSLVLPEQPGFSLEFERRSRGSGGVARPANTRGLHRIALAVEDVRAAAAALRRAGGPFGGPDAVPDPVAFPMPDVPTGGFTVLFLRDPDGAMVELVERPRAEFRLG